MKHDSVKPTDFGSTDRTMTEVSGLLSLGRLCFLVLGEGSYVTQVLPESGAVTIGRASGCEIILDQPNVSRKHAVVHLGEQVTIEDLGSVNGTRVNGQRLKAGQTVTIKPGDQVELGSTVLVLQHRATPRRPRRLFTHGQFEGLLEDQCARAEEAGTPLTLVRLQVTAGPPDLGWLPSMLFEVFRAGCHIAAYGPRDFEVLLSGVDVEEARRAVDEVARRVATRAVKLRCGVAGFGRDGTSPEALMARACEQLEGGRPRADGTIPVLILDPVMMRLHALAERVAASTITVRVLGETGVGKEVLAERIHRLSPRASKPFLRLNCAALAEQLLESELFGHERGAFTGATQSKPGLLQTATGGTVFLDEIGDLSLNLQVKLLRVLEDHQVLRVGALRARPIDVRFIAATHQDLEAAVQRGTFREDLFYRLSGVTLVVPPLRERAAEIEPIARAMVATACQRADRWPPPDLSPETLELLRGYAWPGNVRELRNTMERAVLLCTDATITPEHLPSDKMEAQLAAPLAPTPSGVGAPGGGDVGTLLEQRRASERYGARENRQGSARQKWTTPRVPVGDGP
ncbi:MAG: sigma 54-interacting transcriptional regulator [Deltaproteobacteria bacterium]|nr:sigma 54-interacting transcriptional regulator [Deltaproteobacteria bacterium]